MIPLRKFIVTFPSLLLLTFSLRAMATQVSESGFDLTPLTEEEIKERASELPPLSQDVLFHEGTERAFTGSTVNGYNHDNHETGIYVSAIGGLPLFHSDHKFNSGHK